MSTGADEFAAWLHGERPDGVTDADNPDAGEEQRRRPRPDLSQASGGNGPTSGDPAATFAELMLHRLGRW